MSLFWRKRARRAGLYIHVHVFSIITLAIAGGIGDRDGLIFASLGRMRTDDPIGLVVLDVERAVMTIGARLCEEATKFRIDDSRQKMLLGTLAVLALRGEQIAEFLLAHLLVLGRNLLGGREYWNLNVSEPRTEPFTSSRSTFGVDLVGTGLVPFMIRIIISRTKDNVLVVGPYFETSYLTVGAAKKRAILFAVNDPRQQLFFFTGHMLAVDVKNLLESEYM